jgi:hypothetical protein
VNGFIYFRSLKPSVHLEFSGLRRIDRLEQQRDKLPRENKILKLASRLFFPLEIA